MANYTKATDFAAKDGLTSGDPAKIVKGAEIDDEFNAIVTAVNSKANINSPALTGIPTAPTASAGTTNTQLATTAFVNASISVTTWKIEQSGTDLLFKYNGTTVFKISSNGAIISANDVTAFGSV